MTAMASPGATRPNPWDSRSGALSLPGRLGSSSHGLARATCVEAGSPCATCVPDSRSGSAEHVWIP